MQDIDRVAHVQPLAKPARLRRLRVAVDAKHRRGIARHPWRRRDLGDDASVGPPEAQLAVWLSLHLKPFFVDRAWCLRQSIVRFDSVVGPPCAQ